MRCGIKRRRRAVAQALVDKARAEVKKREAIEDAHRAALAYAERQHGEALAVYARALAELEIATPDLRPVREESKAETKTENKEVAA